MRTHQADYSTKRVSDDLLAEIKSAVKNIRRFGSVEIYIQDYRVTQITERTIRKTDNRGLTK
jgi:hypothetical protein